MELERAKQVLADLTPTDPEVGSEVGIRERGAYLRMHVRADPDRWAVVYSSGNTWSTVEVDTSTLGVPGRFSLDSFHEDSPDTYVETTLREYVAVAEAYLAGSGTLRRSPRLRLPQLTVEIPDGSRVLKRSVVADLRDLLRPRHWFTSFKKV
jgi:hypothetical protein